MGPRNGALTNGPSSVIAYLRSRDGLEEADVLPGSPRVKTRPLTALEPPMTLPCGKGKLRPFRPDSAIVS